MAQNTLRCAEPKIITITPWSWDGSNGMAVKHYENFPVASILLPKAVRPDVVNIYRFARAADDIADEGDASQSQRRDALDEFRRAIETIGQDPAADGRLNPRLSPIFLPLAATISRHRLPLSPFTDLLSAFEQDLEVTRYPTEESLMDYCRRSANPVGRLMLHLFNRTDPTSLQESDAICTALQRINFLQDVGIDICKGRIYIPASAMRSEGVTESHFTEQICDAAWQRLIRQQVTVCRELMSRGAPLGRRLRGRVGLEIRLIVAGGLRILEKIEAARFDVFRQRPTLIPADWIRMVWRAL